MGTLKGFPNPPALWLRRAKPAFAYAIMGTLRGFASPSGLPPAATSPLASPFGDFGTCTSPTTPARYARALALGLAKPSRDSTRRVKLAGSPRDYFSTTISTSSACRLSSAARLRTAPFS